MDLINIFRRLEKTAIDNSPAILTSLGATGVLTTAYLTGKASFRAVELIEREQRHIDRQEKGYPMENRDKVNLVWRLYLPAISTGLLTMSAIIFANKVSNRRAASMAAAYSISERAFTEYKEKVIEKIGEKKEQEFRDEVAQDRVTRNPVNDNTVIITDTGEVLCYDQYTGRYFKSSVESLKQAENTVNYTILHHDYASLSDFYSELGLPPTRVSDEVGWTTDQLLSLDISTVMSNNNRPCIAIDFNHRPIRGFNSYS